MNKMWTEQEKQVLRQQLLRLELYDNPYLIFEFAKFMDIFREIRPGVFRAFQPEDEEPIDYNREEIMSKFYKFVTG